MAHEKMKSESFQNLQGINVKASPYLTGPQEYLNLVNFDFQTPGSLTKRWGSTQYMTQGYTGQIQSVVEYNKLNGSSSIVFSVSGGLWAGGTNAQMQGLSLTYQQPLVSAFQMNTNVILARVGAFVGSTLTQFAQAFEGNSNYIRSIAGFQQITDTSTLNTNKLSYVTLNDRLYMADGNIFQYYDGITTCPVLIAPPGNAGYVSGSTFFVPTITAITGGGDVGFSAGLNYFLYAGVQTRDGRNGPIWPIGALGLAEGVGATLNAAFGTTNVGYGCWIAVPTFYGASGINLYWAAAGTSAWSAYDYTTGEANSRINIPSWNVSGLNRCNTISATGATTGAVNGIGTASFIMSVVAATFTSSIKETVVFDNKMASFGASTYLDGAFTPVRYYTRNNPKYLEAYNNQLFCAGFTGLPSTIFYSDIGAPSSFDIESFFELRTNDGDVVTGMKAFNSNLMLFKTNSYHQLTGDDPANFTIRQMSDQYGCLNHRSAVTYDNYLVFLDRKGIIRHSGSNQETLSTKIQDVFDTMNVSAAKDTACMVHDKKRSQILCGIPVNGATFNNLTVVYDYLINAWTKHEGYNPSVFAIIQGNLTNRTVFYGGYTGNIFNQGASYFGDNGAGYTCLIKTRYLSDLGQSVEKQFRRLFLNVDPVTGTTSSFNIKMYPNYGSSVGFTATMYANPFQSRIDFGLSARSLAFELSNNSASDSVKLHGYVLEYRMQRNV